MDVRQSLAFLGDARALSQIDKIKLQSSVTTFSLQVLSNSGSNGLDVPKSPILVLNLFVKMRNRRFLSRKIKFIIDKKRKIEIRKNSFSEEGRKMQKWNL